MKTPEIFRIYHLSETGAWKQLSRQMQSKVKRLFTVIVSARRTYYSVMETEGNQDISQYLKALGAAKSDNEKFAALLMVRVTIPHSNQ